MDPFQDYRTDFLIYIFFMDKNRYNKDYILQVKDELIKRNFNFDNLNQELYIRLVAKDFFSGWEKQTEKMFAELIANGWTFQQPLDYKESWGRLLFRGFQTEVSSKFHQILEKYIQIFESTCGICGSRKKVENPDDQYFCRKCYLKHLKKFRINNIDKKGFSYFNKKKQYVFWSQINNIEWQTDGYDTFSITLNKISPEQEITKDYNETDYIFFSSEFFNFFKLLRKIPAQFLTEIQNKEIGELCNSLKKCAVCNRKSVLSTVINKKCIVCKTLTEKLENPTERYLKKLENQQGIVTHEKKRFRQNLEDNTLFRYKYKTDMSFK